jgi:outer membrane receptor for monomeric catechols
MEVTNYGLVTPTSSVFFDETWEPITGRTGLVYVLTSAANVYVQYNAQSTVIHPPWRLFPLQNRSAYRTVTVRVRNLTDEI